ncbi:hypothetical protein RHMOL_Rhmol09G0176000 [Rhododendron molle]|uniref:Uncharacterized protein n=1 Tax=Rhododendron molle TaxID=49168 RepID=A0ACC0MEN2_RHOML|nr:hypothetical protein RHMOL_Rhmol09G0176000 [Rhododendron molle]
MGESLVLRGTMRAHTNWVTAIATPIDNSDMIVTASRDKSIILWNLTKEDKVYGPPPTTTTASPATPTSYKTSSSPSTASSPYPAPGTASSASGTSPLGPPPAASSATPRTSSPSPSPSTTARSSPPPATARSSFGTPLGKPAFCISHLDEPKLGFLLNFVPCFFNLVPCNTLGLNDLVRETKNRMDQAIEASIKIWDLESKTAVVGLRVNAKQEAKMNESGTAQSSGIKNKKFTWEIYLGFKVGAKIVVLTCKDNSCVMCQRARSDERLMRWYKYEEGLWKIDEWEQDNLTFEAHQFVTYVSRLKQSFHIPPNQWLEGWLRREIQALLQEEDVEIIVHHVLGVVDSLRRNQHQNSPSTLETQEETFKALVCQAARPFLTGRTDPFAHEVELFLASGLNIDAYDKVYMQRLGWQPPGITTEEVDGESTGDAPLVPFLYIFDDSDGNVDWTMPQQHLACTKASFIWGLKQTDLRIIGLVVMDSYFSCY